MNDRHYENDIKPEFDYIKLALRTNSPQFHGNLVPKRVFEGIITELINHGNRLDTAKKSLFYGRVNAFIMLSGEDTLEPIDSVNYQQVLHGIIGIATESIELLEALQKPVDPVNIKEEVGDIFWYCAILAHYLGFTFEEAQRSNIEKLKARFPDRFTEHKANNRDLEVERSIIENGYNKSDQVSIYEKGSDLAYTSHESIIKDGEF